jgi:hypothetical protein
MSVLWFAWRWVMSPTCIPVVNFQTALGRQWLSTLLVAAGSYAAVMDPRPDLAIPARSIKFPYLWWW